MAKNTSTINPPQKSAPQHTQHSPTSTEKSSWITRVNAALKRRAGTEREIAAVLAEHKKKVGTKQWLEDCEREWGWSSSTAYRHLDPKQMEAARAHTCAASPKVGAKQPTCAECGEVSSGMWQTHDAGCSKETAAQKISRAQAAEREVRESCQECGVGRHGVHRSGCSKTPPPTPKELRTAKELREQKERDALARDAAVEAYVVMTNAPGYHEDRLAQTILGKLRAAIDEIEAEREHLTNRLVERLDEQWIRLGAVIERYGDEGGGMGKELTRRERDEMAVAS